MSRGRLRLVEARRGVALGRSNGDIARLVGLVSVLKERFERKRGEGRGVGRITFHMALPMMVPRSGGTIRVPSMAAVFGKREEGPRRDVGEKAETRLLESVRDDGQVTY